MCSSLWFGHNLFLLGIIKYCAQDATSIHLFMSVFISMFSLMLLFDRFATHIRELQSDEITTWVYMWIVKRWNKSCTSKRFLKSCTASMSEQWITKVTDYCHYLWCVSAELHTGQGQNYKIYCHPWASTGSGKAFFSAKTICWRLTDRLMDSWCWPPTSMCILGRLVNHWSTFCWWLTDQSCQQRRGVNGVISTTRIAGR